LVKNSTAPATKNRVVHANILENRRIGVF